MRLYVLYAVFRCCGVRRMVFACCFVAPYLSCYRDIGDAPNNNLTNNPNNPQQWQQFVDNVKAGDVLSFRAWFDDEPLNNQVVCVVVVVTLSSCVVF